MKPNRIDVINDTLAIVWDDGQESFVTLEAVRRACPCAGCKGERTVLTEFKPVAPVYSPRSFALAGWEFVGAYGWQPRWADGHATGIYSFEYLKSLEGQPA